MWCSYEGRLPRRWIIACEVCEVGPTSQVVTILHSSSDHSGSTTIKKFNWLLTRIHWSPGTSPPSLKYALKNNRVFLQHYWTLMLKHELDGTCKLGWTATHSNNLQACWAWKMKSPRTLYESCYKTYCSRPCVYVCLRFQSNQHAPQIIGVALFLGVCVFVWAPAGKHCSSKE